MIAVCVLTPLPALLLVVALELIPLQNPTDGWEKNYGAWLRFGVISFTVGVGLTVQMKGMSGNIAIFYTGLSAAFASLSDHAQIVFVALLPLIRLVFKNAVASVSSFLEEYVSGIVVFSAELAHALFAATCMQTARSPLASVVIISFDALSSILSLRSIYRSTQTVQKLLVNREQPQLIAEVLSLLVLYLVIQRRFGFSILHQLAFVLETHAMQVQGRMFVWTAFILTFTLEHFGSDFTFQLEWMRNKDT
ncbi:hypothetical protein PHYSODRAFT_334736 [Phytophthora sojae]|uniref:Uncharacterized protein n=1 Tax=Phytophthora sojae (strain P6497) TaxID=1094619 RepID=G4ZTD2_PHYSP|nr:hypothetical protein PHYSODRAFT_334736 [Phytophthora sojae]EGZ12896.1 hypothetical protein PHYSODRAFT_334736 [Phytophthora sojae]|eukprot:XP_009530325.1 hypothetical protein PHYSODRAFT_334736 [Phytophthora sojae]